MLEPGMCLKTKTKTKDDVFGDVIWMVIETGLPCPLPACGRNDGVKCKMLGGNGPAARPGFTVHDCEQVIARNMKDRVTQIISQNEATNMAVHYAGGGAKRIGSGRDVAW